MKVYHYDKNGYYTGSTDARLDPEETKLAGQLVYLLPANATFSEPPATVAGQVPQWVNGAWALVTDPSQFVVFFRNKTGLDTKVLGGSAYSECVVNGVTQYNGLPLTDPSNANVAALVIPSSTIPYSAINENGVETMAVVNGQLTARDPARIAADPANARSISSNADIAVFVSYQSLTGNAFDPLRHNATVTGLMYTAQNIDGSASAADIANAKAELVKYKQAYDQMNATYATRDAQLAALDVE